MASQQLSRKTTMSTSSDFLPSERAQWASGQPISQLMSQALANPSLISLAAGFVDPDSLPVEPTREVLDRLFTNPAAARAALQYGTTPGYPLLRDALLRRELAADGQTADETKLTSQRVVITAGSNQLLHLVAESILNRGDIVLCAAPTYFVFLGTLNNMGAHAIGVASDEQGMVPEALEDMLRHLEKSGDLPRVKAIYLVPYFDNPCGITMPQARRASIVELAKRWSRFHHLHVIADSAYRELRYEGQDVPSTLSLDEEKDTVIEAGTFSKSYSPGIRIGWGILPQHLVEPVCNQKGNIDFGSPNFSQYLMAEVLNSGLFEQHVARIRATYREKLTAMLAAAEEFFQPLHDVRWRRPQGGLYVWMTLPEGVSTGPEGMLLPEAIRQGVLYVPGQYCYPPAGSSVPMNTLRLSFGVQSRQRIGRGMACLAEAVRKVLGCY